MTFEESYCEHEEAWEDWDDWVFVDGDWWQLSYADVDWACLRRYHWTETGVKLTFHPRPPQYQDTLYNVKEDYGYDGVGPRDVELNRALVGVKGAEDTLEPYEYNVGICDAASPLSHFSFTAELLLPEDASEDDIQWGRDQWEQHVEELLGGILERSCYDLPPCSPSDGVRMWNLDALDNPFADSDLHDIVDLTDSDISVESDPLPTTPQGDKKSYAEVLFDDRGAPQHAGTVVSPSPSKPLNASALSFIPSFFLDQHSPSPTSDEPYVSPTYEFHFPSLGNNAAPRTRSLPPSLPLQRDEQGFYNEIPYAAPQSTAQSRAATPKRASPTGVHPFMGSAPPRQGSKTREMVDRLRSNSSSGSRRSRKSKGEASALRKAVDAAAPQPDRDADGWITGVDAGTPPRARVHKGGDGDWVQGLFQCRAPAKPPHRRSASTATSGSAAGTAPRPPTPSSVASTLSTLPSPTSSTFSNPRTPTSTQFPVAQFYAFQPPYAAYPSYPMPPQGPPVPMMQPQWQMHGPMVPAPPAYVLPPPMYGSSPYDTRKAAPVGGARHA